MKSFLCLSAAIFLLGICKPVLAAGICDANDKPEDAAVHVVGVITDRDTEGGMLSIKDDCGEIVIFLPEGEFETCRVGATAEVIGVIYFGVVEANAVLCE